MDKTIVLRKFTIDMMGSEKFSFYLCDCVQKFYERYNYVSKLATVMIVLRKSTIAMIVLRKFTIVMIVLRKFFLSL